MLTEVNSEQFSFSLFFVFFIIFFCLFFPFTLLPYITTPLLPFLSDQTPTPNLMSSPPVGACTRIGAIAANPEVIDVDTAEVEASTLDIIDLNTDDGDAIDVDAIDANTTKVAITNADAAHVGFANDSFDDPLPDIHDLFAYYNKKYFDSQLSNVYVEFSSRMTLCAGTCTYRGSIGGCRIALSEPLLKFRPSADLRSTLLHEMIHAHLFNRGISRDGPDGHGPIFMQFASKINSSEPSPVRITPYHNFEAEVDHYRVHHWKCDKCNMLIKRAMNRRPGQHDVFWKKHVTSCGGTFTKIAGPARSKNSSVSRPRVIAMSKNVTRKTLSSLPPKTVPTRRIEDMLSQKPKSSDTALLCPVCNQYTPKYSLNEHLDACLTRHPGSDADFNEQSKEPRTTIFNPTPAGSKHNLRPSVTGPSPISREIKTVIEKKASFSRSSCPVQKRLHPQQSSAEPLDQLTCNYDTLAMLAFKPQSFSASQTEQVFASICHPESHPPRKKPMLSFRQLLSPLFRDESAIEREELAKSILYTSELLSLQTNASSPKHTSQPDSPVIYQSTPASASNDGTDNCPICNKAVIRSQLSLHINTCMDQTGLKSEFCDSDQDIAVEALSKNSHEAIIEPSKCPVCDVTVPRQSLERHVGQCMTSMGLRDAF